MIKVFQYLFQLTSEECQLLSSLITFRKLKKGSFLIFENQVCNEISFVKSGILRSFFLNSKEEEITNCFTFENEFMTAFSSFITQKPTDENIQAITDCELEIIDKLAIERLFNSSFRWADIGRRIAENEVVNLHYRIACLQKKSAIERYETLFINHEKYIKHIPLIYLASYLGISTRHLSRIRQVVVF
ncbi:Crp/Fnr family transcriptional regulator [Flavobacterium sp. 5]|uniref:Crp/Fnr family transcriptional regulator n=1 Tax=Flavobacterium sp. 5 TaxID=2035199 RepID=UPI000C2B55D2|nr:Crp/Fnr family transcriptional regulator [Flavobacterium sp. 5]PKB18917.1 CRP-like cAMP-binding protein [Flavobacterium sp. 5]